MSDDVKGVFVRLPLSESDRRLVKLSYSGSMNSDEAFDKALLSIGAPVVGGEVEPVCSIDEDILRDIRELGDDDEEYVTDMVFKPDPEGVDTIPLVRKSDVLAKLAEKDAEIARLRDVLSLFTEYDSLMEDGEYAAAMSAYANFQFKVKESLKGSEA